MSVIPRSENEANRRRCFRGPLRIAAGPAQSDSEIMALVVAACQEQQRHEQLGRLLEDAWTGDTLNQTSQVGVQLARTRWFDQICHGTRVKILQSIDLVIYWFVSRCTSALHLTLFWWNFAPDSVKAVQKGGTQWGNAIGLELLQ